MKFPEKYRYQLKPYISDVGEPGLFCVPLGFHTNKIQLNVIASNGQGWEHVSVSIHCRDRCPTWEEMCYVKDLFWEKNEAVVQYHPPEREYVNNHKYCLHLWKKVGYEWPMPPRVLVGV